MADTSISGLPAVTTANVADPLPIVNAGATKRITVANLKNSMSLGNVENTSDANKPVSTAQQAALDLKESLSNKSDDSALGASSTLYPTQNAVKSYVDTALTAKQDFIVAGTTTQYYRGDKTMVALTKGAVGLGNVDNTSDANKPISTAQQAEFDRRIFGSIVSDFATTSTTLVGTGLSVPVGANQKWGINFFVLVNTSSNLGLNYAISQPSGATSATRYQGTSTALGTTALMRDNNAEAGAFQQSTPSPYGYMEAFTVVETSSTAGNVELQLKNLGAQTATVSKFSYWTAFRIS